MGEIRSYKDLDVWQSAMALAEACYRSSRHFPASELYGMTSQIRRSAASIAANIAEGYGRESTPAFIQFLRIAQGSPKELETYLLLAERVDVLAKETSEPLLANCERVSKMLRGLIRSLEAKS